MEYKGKYTAFDPTQIKTYPVSTRTNKVKFSDLHFPEEVLKTKYEVGEGVEERLEKLAKDIVEFRKQGKPVVMLTGGHMIKNGLSPLVADMVKKDMITLFAGNGATSIHDFELGLIGETSEYVPQALEKGEFGMAFEFNYINAAVTVGNSMKLGYGESVGRMFNDEGFRKKVQEVLRVEEDVEFLHSEICLQSICYQNDVPFTVHAGIGTDVLDQHEFFDGADKGGCSGRDFLIYTEEITKFTEGGIIMNIGSAVTGPEVFLKAASMAGNIGKVPDNIITANFDLRPYDPKVFSNEEEVGYYYRDQKSIVTRVPQAYNGKGYYISGNQLATLPMLYQKIIELI